MKEFIIKNVSQDVEYKYLAIDMRDAIKSHVYFTGLKQVVNSVRIDDTDLNNMTVLINFEDMYYVKEVQND